MRRARTQISALQLASAKLADGTKCWPMEYARPRVFIYLLAPTERFTIVSLCSFIDNESFISCSADLASIRIGWCLLKAIV